MNAVRTTAGEWTMEPGVRADGTICDQSMFFDCGWTRTHSLGLGVLLVGLALSHGPLRRWLRQEVLPLVVAVYVGGFLAILTMAWLINGLRLR